MVAERAQRAATLENTCKYKKHQQIKKTSLSVWQHVLQMLTTQTNKETHCKCSQHTHTQKEKNAQVAQTTTKLPQQNEN